VPSVGEAWLIATLFYESLFTGSAAAIGQWGRPPHVFIDVRKLRLDPAGAPLSRALWGRMRFYDFCKRDLLRARPRTTRTSKPLSYGRDCCRSIESCLSIAATAGAARGQGLSKPKLSALYRDCSRQRLCPNLDRSRCPVSRASFFALSGETRGRERCRHIAPACTADATQRVVWRPVSAKRPDAHQPEAPSVIGPALGPEAPFRAA
jgi:hypothetical protein